MKDRSKLSLALRGIVAVLCARAAAALPEASSRSGGAGRAPAPGAVRGPVAPAAAAYWPPR